MEAIITDTPAITIRAFSLETLEIIFRRRAGWAQPGFALRETPRRFQSVARLFMHTDAQSAVMPRCTPRRSRIVAALL